jgi:hypothetical protein
MNIDQLRNQFPDEDACRSFFETILWKNGRISLSTPSLGQSEQINFCCISDCCSL